MTRPASDSPRAFVPVNEIADAKREKRKARRAREAAAPLREFYVCVSYEFSSDADRFSDYIFARSAGQARAAYWRRLRECFDGIQFGDISVRRAAFPATTPDFERMKAIRGIPFAKIKMRVTVDGKAGTIVGSYGDYINVIFDGQHHEMNAHPNWRVTYFDDAGAVLRSFDGDGSVIGGAA